MRRLTLADLPDPASYDALRPALRAAVIAHKRDRRVSVGERVSLVFEDRETLRWQVLEMARVEGIRDPQLLQQELDVYNELVPGEGELSATLFIEITDRVEIRPELDRLIGIDEHVSLRLGEGGPTQTIRARFDAKQFEDERIAAVQYVRFALSPQQRARFADPRIPVAIVIDHPGYRAEAVLGSATRRSLARDLEGGCPPLVDLDAEPESPIEPAIVAESPRVVAWRRSPTRIDLEPRDPVDRLADAPPDLVGEVTALAARLGRDLGVDDWELSVDLSEKPVRWSLGPRR